MSPMLPQPKQPSPRQHRLTVDYRHLRRWYRCSCGQEWDTHIQWEEHVAKLAERGERLAEYIRSTADDHERRAAEYDEKSRGFWNKFTGRTWEYEHAAVHERVTAARLCEMLKEWS